MPECFHRWTSTGLRDGGAAYDVCFSCGKSRDEMLQTKPVEVLPDLTGNLFLARRDSDQAYYLATLGMPGLNYLPVFTTRIKLEAFYSSAGPGRMRARCMQVVSGGIDSLGEDVVIVRDPEIVLRGGFRFLQAAPLPEE